MFLSDSEVALNFLGYKFEKSQKTFWAQFGLDWPDFGPGNCASSLFSTDHPATLYAKYKNLMMVPMKTFVTKKTDRPSY